MKTKRIIKAILLVIATLALFGATATTVDESLQLCWSFGCMAVFAGSAKAWDKLDRR